MEAIHRLSADSSCTGLYKFGLESVLPGFKVLHPELVKGGTMAYRVFVPESTSATATSVCNIPPNMTDPSQRACMDTWFVKVRDPSSKIVAE